jgi:hypothetical protein
VVAQVQVVAVVVDQFERERHTASLPRCFSWRKSQVGIFCGGIVGCGLLGAWGVVEFLVMRRVHAILVIVALLATPLALLARAIDPSVTNCGGICCLPHGHYAPTHHAAHATPANEPSCHHEGASPTPELNCTLDCAMHSSPHGSNYGLLTPIAPTKPSNLFSLRLAPQTQSASSGATAFPRSGFLASPFQPPRA